MKASIVAAFSLMVVIGLPSLVKGFREKPTIARCPNSTTVQVGDSITWTCVEDPQGGKPDSFTWYKSGQPVWWNAIFSKVVETSDSGEYTCTAWYNKYSPLYDESDWLTLTVNDPPNTPTITGWPDKFILDVGKSLSLTCRATTAGGSSMSYIWYKDSAILPNQTNAKYFKRNVTSTDGGEYVCQAESDDIHVARNSTVRTLFIKGGCMPIKASPQAENSKNQVEFILAVTLTIIVLLVIAVVILVVFLVRMKRSLIEMESRGEIVAFRAESNGSGAAVNKMQDRNSSGVSSNFDAYSALGERNVGADDEYANLGKQKRIARPQAVKDIAVYDNVSEVGRRIPEERS